MAIDVTILTTTEECDAALDILNAEKTLLERRRRNLDEALQGRSDTTAAISTGIASVQALIAGYQAALAVMVDAREIRNIELKIEREETKLKSLQNRQANYNVVAMLEDHVDLEQYDVQIPVLDTAIADVTAHRATL